MSASRPRIASPTRTDWTVTDSFDRPGTFSAELRPDAGSTPILLTARIGRLGDARAQSELLDRVERRLGQLRGVDSAPIDWD